MCKRLHANLDKQQTEKQKRGLHHCNPLLIALNKT